MKKLLSVLLLTLSVSAFADNNDAKNGPVTFKTPGDVMFGLDVSPNNHAYRFRLVRADGAVTNQTSCIAPNTGINQTLSYDAIRQSPTTLSVEANDCVTDNGTWIKLKENFSYDQQFYYNVVANMNNNTWHN